MIDQIIRLNMYRTHGVLTPSHVFFNPKYRGFLQMFCILVEERMPPVGQLEIVGILSTVAS